MSKQLIPFCGVEGFPFAFEFGVKGREPHVVVCGVFEAGGEAVVGVFVAELDEGLSHCWGMVSRILVSLRGLGWSISVGGRIVENCIYTKGAVKL
jgi:hypothetical protein